jgi:hypothetical protein
MRAWTWEGEMKAAVFRGLRDLRLEEIPDPVCGPRDVVLEVQACGICGQNRPTPAQPCSSRGGRRPAR